MTKLQRLTIGLTICNLILFLAGVTPLRRVSAQETAVPSVLRARSLEIVDAEGHVRAEIKVLPADPTIKMPDGTQGYPESVLLRLISSQKNPNVKLSTTEDGAGLVLGSDKGHVQVLSRNADPAITLVARDGRERVIKP